MSLQDLIPSNIWSLYTKKMIAAIENPHSLGYFSEEDAKERGMECVKGTASDPEQGRILSFFWLLDPADGLVVDAKFKVFGPSALIAASDAACELCVGKNLHQIQRLTSQHIDRYLRDDPTKEAFFEEIRGDLNFVLKALDSAIDNCSHFSFASSFENPIPRNVEDREMGGYPGWVHMSLERKLVIIEDVLNEHVRPYIALDAGGIEVLELRDNHEVFIAYQGNCTSCISSVGGTLQSIQEILQSKVHPEITVVPDVSDLKFMEG